MRFRNTLILLVILVLGIWSVTYLNKRDVKKEESKKANEKLLNLSSGPIQELWLEPGDFHAVRDSSEWRIVSPIQTLGDKSALDAIANLFDWAKTERVVSSDPSEHGEFGLRPETKRLIVRHSTQVDTFYVGDTNPTGSFVYAFKSGGQDVVLTTTSLKTNIEKSFFDLRDKSVLAFEQAQVREATLQRGAQQMMFAKEGAEWKISRPKTVKADAAKITDLLSKVSSQRVTSYVDENPAELKTYGLDAPALIFSVFLGENRAQKTLAIGRQSGDQFFARDLSRRSIFKVDTAFVHRLQVSLADVRSKKVLSFNASEVNRLTVRQNDSTFVFVKDTSNTWTMTAPQPLAIKGWKISSLVSELELMNAVSFVDDAPSALRPFGLDAPQVLCELYQDDRLIDQLLIGRRDGKDGLFVNSGGHSAVYTVSKDLLDKIRINLPQLLEPAAPDAAGTVK